MAAPQPSMAGSLPVATPSVNPMFQQCFVHRHFSAGETFVDHGKRKAGRKKRRGKKETQTRAVDFICEVHGRSKGYEPYTNKRLAAPIFFTMIKVAP